MSSLCSQDGLARSSFPISQLTLPHHKGWELQGWGVDFFTPTMQIFIEGPLMGRHCAGHCECKRSGKRPGHRPCRASCLQKDNPCWISMWSPALSSSVNTLNCPPRDGSSDIKMGVLCQPSFPFSQEALRSGLGGKSESVFPPLSSQCLDHSPPEPHWVSH